MRKAAKWLLAGAGTVAAATAGTVTVVRAVSKKLLSIAMDREAPKIMSKGREKISGSPEVANALQRSEKTAKILEACGCTDVEIVSRDGNRLVGHLYKCPSAKRIIIAMHGWRSSWSKDFGVISQFFHSNDCSVLYAEQRAQNQSEGEYMTFGLLERYDCLDWVSWTNEQFGDSLPIYLAGVSMGATTVLMTADLDMPDNVYGIIADCGFTSPHAIWKHVVENNLHLPYSLHDAQVKEIVRKKICMGPQDHSTVESLKKCRIPVLFIHGANDSFVPVSMTYENYRACAAPKELLIVPGAEHGMSYIVEQEKYESTVRSFWAQCERAAR